LLIDGGALVCDEVAYPISSACTRTSMTSVCSSAFDVQAIDGADIRRERLHDPRAKPQKLPAPPPTGSWAAEFTVTHNTALNSATW
jgi:hypothetical protein